MSIYRFPASPFVRVRSSRFDGSVLPFPPLVRTGVSLAGTRAADIALRGSRKSSAGGPVIDQRNLTHEEPVWAMLVSHAGAREADAWREGFAFRDYVQPAVSWLLADIAAIDGRSYSLYSAEPRPGMPKVMIVHADDQNVFRSILTDEGPMDHSDLHNRLRADAVSAPLGALPLRDGNRTDRSRRFSG